jgi:general secretion pathway protein D
MRQLKRIATLAALTVAVVSQAFAQDSALTKRVDLFLRGADLLNAVQALTLQTGLQFVVVPNSEGFRKIDLNLAEVTAEEAIKYICQAAGAYAERDANGVFIIRAGTPDTKVEADPELPIARPKVIRRIKIMRADPKLVYDMVTKAQVVENGNEMRDLQIMGSDIINRVTPQAPKTAINYLNGSASPVAYPLNTAADDIALPGEGAKQLGGGGGGQLGGGGGGQLGGGGQDGATGLQGGEGFVPQGIDRVTYDPTDNSLIVQGTEEAIRELERLIEQFDVAPKQVVIKVEFVATNQSLDKALGIDWLYARGTMFAGVRPGEFARSGDPVFFNYSTGNIQTRLRTLLNSGWGRTVSAPLVRTLNNQPAFVSQGTVIYIFQPVVNQGNGTFQTVFQPIPVPVTTFLAVRPRINNDGTVTVFLSPSVQDITGFTTSPDGTQYPNIVFQNISLVARVKSGETIALAGFTAKRDSYSVKRIPILSDLPIIGQLFRSRDEVRRSSELLVFVTPTVIDENSGGLEP